jgi:hypothetical protein
MLLRVMLDQEIVGIMFPYGVLLIKKKKVSLWCSGFSLKLRNTSEVATMYEIL